LSQVGPEAETSTVCWLFKICFSRASNSS